MGSLCFMLILLLMFSSQIAPCDVSMKMSANIGYYQSWAVWRNGCNVVHPKDIDVEGMGYNHLIYSFASISASFAIEPWKGADYEEVPRMLEMNALKETHPNLKTLIGVGGWTHNDPGVLCSRFSDASSTPSRREVFAKSVIDFLNTVRCLCIMIYSFPLLKNIFHRFQ